MRYQSIKQIASLGLLAASLALASALQAQPLVLGGWNGFDTVSGTSYNGIPFQGIPLGTFDFGSGPENVGNVDTIIQRMGPAVFTPGGTMPIQVVALQLRTVNQIDLGAGLGYYYATLDTSVPNQNSGVMTIDSFPAGISPGTFHDFFDVYFDIRFGSLTGPIVAEEPPLTLTASGDWLTTLPIPSTPIVHHNNEGPGDWHYVVLDTDIDPDGFYPYGVVPEPSGLALLGLGVLCLASKTQRGRKQATQTR